MWSQAAALSVAAAYGPTRRESRCLAFHLSGKLSHPPPGEPWMAVRGGSPPTQRNAPHWPYAPLGLPTPPWTFARIPGPHPVAEAIRLLDDRLAGSISAELTFAEWFTRWDAGPWPVVIDRTSLGTAGLGPKSRCMPTTAKSSPRNMVMATLKQYGLTLLPYDSIFVITTESEISNFEAA